MSRFIHIHTIKLTIFIHMNKNCSHFQKSPPQWWNEICPSLTQDVAHHRLPCLLMHHLLQLHVPSWLPRSYLCPKCEDDAVNNSINPGNRRHDFYGVYPCGTPSNARQMLSRSMPYEPYAMNSAITMPTIGSISVHPVHIITIPLITTPTDTRASAAI